MMEVSATRTAPHSDSPSRKHSLKTSNGSHSNHSRNETRQANATFDLSKLLEDGRDGGGIDMSAIDEFRLSVFSRLKGITSGLRQEQDRIEQHLRMAQALVHNQSDESNILSSDNHEAEHLKQSQIKERARLEDRLRAEAEELIEAEEVQRTQARLWAKVKALTERIHDLEEAREIESASRNRLTQKRNAFESKIGHLETRQMNQRKQLAEAQSRQETSTQQISELENKHMSDRDKASLAKLDRLFAEHHKVIQRKQAEQLRECQLLEQKHTAVEFEIEFRTAEERYIRPFPGGSKMPITKRAHAEPL
eukprot:Opistho-2@62457